MNADHLQELETLLRTCAREELLPRFRRVSASLKSDGSILTEADLAMDARLRAALTARWPETDFLSEEMSAEEQRALLTAGDRPLWCLDPLDGTSNFAGGIPLFAVSLALIRDGAPQLGLIYDPVRDES